MFTSSFLEVENYISTHFPKASFALISYGDENDNEEVGEEDEENEADSKYCVKFDYKANKTQEINIR